MADIKWCQTPSGSDCITDWNNMVQYIKHSAVTDFTIHEVEGTCTDIGQAFLFSALGIESLMYGGADAGDTMTIYANSADPCPSISLIGSQGITNRVAWDDQFEVATCSDETLLMVSSGGFSYKGVDVCLEPCGGCPTDADLPFTLWNDCDTHDEKGFQFSISGTVSTMQGSDDSGDDLRLKANSNNTYPYIDLIGNDSIRLYTHDNVTIYDDTEPFLKFEHSTPVSYILGSDDTGDALRIHANSIDNEPYIQMEGDDFVTIDVASYIYFKDQGTQSFMFDYASNISKMFGGAATGDDLWLVANTVDDCPSITMSGNLSMHCNISDIGIFEVSTCSDEQLFTVDVTTTDNHVDFHCLDAHNFCLEIRTSDPASPTCTGQIWFRKDLA